MVDGVSRQPGIYKQLHTEGAHHVRHQVLNDAATALGLSRQDLAKALAGGKSLADVATDQGVSRDDLLAAVKKGAVAAGAAPDSTTLDALVARLADLKPKTVTPPVDTPPTTPPGDGSDDERPAIYA